jgi:hypothetical protein
MVLAKFGMSSTSKIKKSAADDDDNDFTPDATWKAG